MKDPSDEAAIRQGSIRKPLREPRSTTSLRNPSSPNLAIFPTSSSSSKAAAGADAFDVIVQASNPSHPQHAAWVEHYGGSIRNTRKSIDGPSTSYHGENTQPPSLPRSRSRTASKVGTTPNAKSRPALDDVMMVPDASVWTLLANQDHGLGESDRLQNRRQASAPGRSVEETNTNKAYKEASGSARQRTGSSDIRSDATVGASSVKTNETDRGQRRRRKKEKGKARAAAPPVPPPRTTSHAAYLEQTQDTLSPITNENAVGEGETSASPPSLPYLPKKSFDASNSPTNLSPRLADDTRLRYGNDRMGSIDERGMDVQSPSLLSPTTANTFALRQSSVSPELPQGSPASTASSPPPTRTMFTNFTHSLPGRRSVDFRLPDDDMMKLRQENAKPQRRGLDAIFSPLRSAVAGRRAEKQAAAAAPSPLQSEAKKPLPILRVGTSTRASVDIAQRIAPTPPPRSPLRRTPIIQQEENNRNDESPITSNSTSHVQEGSKEAPQAFTMDKISASNSGKIDKDVIVGTGISLNPQNEAIAEKVKDVPTLETAVPEKDPSPVTRPQPKLSSTPSMQTTNSSDTTARSQKTFVSLPKSNTHSRSLSMDTEEGQEFHDAISDEGGLGSSDDAMPSNSSTVKKRRSRHKSIENVNAARLQAKEAALNEPLPDANKQIEKTELDPITRQRRDSSASEDMIPTTGRKNSLKRKVSKKQIRTSATKKETTLPSKPISAAKVEQMDDKIVRDQSHRQSAATITNSNIHRREVDTSNGDLDGRRKTVTQSSLDGEFDRQPIETNDNVQGMPKELPDIPTADFTPTPASLENGFQRHNFGFSKSQSSRDIADNYRAAQRKAAETGSIDYKQLPLPPPPLPSMPNSPVDVNLKRQVAHQRSYSRINQSQSSNNGGKISGVFSRMRKDKTPSFSNLRGSDSQNTSLTGSTSQLNLISPSQSPVQDDRNSGIGLGIDTASMQSSKGTNTSDQHFPSSPSPQQPIRSPSSESGWRNRLPSFSASRAAKTQKGERNRTESNQQQPPPPPIPRQSSNSQMQRQQLLYEAVAQSMSDNSLVQKTVPLSPTIHKTLSPALLREERHEADEVGSFIGSEEAEEERLADSRRGTWNSFSNFELAPNKVYDASAELSNSTTSQTPTIDIKGPTLSSMPKSNTTPSNLTSGSFSSPITPQMNDPNLYLRPSGSFSPDVMNLSMTARRLSRSSSNHKFQSVPQALDLSPGKSSKPRKQESPSDGMEIESYDDSRMSPFLSNSPAIYNNGEKEAFGSLSFPSSPGQSSITGSGNEAKRSRNLSIGSTLLGNITGNSNNGNGSNTIKPRSSFAMDRDRSPVVNQAWTDLPPSPSPRSTGVRKFFTSAAKSNLRIGKNTNNTFMSPGRPSFQAGSPNDVSFPISPALPSGQSAMFTDLWKQDSSRANGNAHSGMPSSSSFNSTSSYPLAQSASASSLQQATISSQDHSSQQSSSSPITNHLRQAGLPRGMPSTSLHSSTSLNDSLHKEWVTHTNGDSPGGVGASGSIINAESVYSNSSSRNITSQRMIDSGSFSPSNSATNEADLQAFGRMLRESAKEDAQRVRQIAQKSVSANNTPHLP